MNFDHFRRRADRVREVPLETVLALRNAVRDPGDRRKWHTEQGPVSITGQKFTNWHRNTGGGGAIDLVMHLADLDAGAAVVWLEQHSPAGYATAGVTDHHPSSNRRTASSVPLSNQTGKLRLPDRDASKLRRVQNYLTQHRNLSSLVLEPQLFLERVLVRSELFSDISPIRLGWIFSTDRSVPVGVQSIIGKA